MAPEVLVIKRTLDLKRQVKKKIFLNVIESSSMHKKTVIEGC